MKNNTDTTPISLQSIPERWDMIVVGGGITGAGIFREAVRLNLRVLLLEQRDFAWGTSSRSSKLVHGGLRYLKEGHFRLTRDAVKERERLLQDAPGLVKPVGFLVPVYKGRGPGRWALEAGLSVYDLIAKKRQHRFFNASQLLELVPYIDQKDLIGGFQFFDAQVDDARLVLRLINEALRYGGHALNYTKALEIFRDSQGKVAGLRAEDAETHFQKTLSAATVVNATGTWAESLHPSLLPDRHLRPLRGSHMIFPLRVLPIAQAISFIHPNDQRAVFAVPWEGVVLVGTTDLDHDQDPEQEPAITAEEIHYLMSGLKALFPSLDISLKDCVSVYAGVRPVISKGAAAASEESREYAVWKDNGLVTATGGKLTTFRLIAFDALKAARQFLPSMARPDPNAPVFSPMPEMPNPSYGLSPQTWAGLSGRYGAAAHMLAQSASPKNLSTIPGTSTLWAELPFAAKYEQIRHLDDLLLRRVRVGLLTPHGGKTYLRRIRKLCQPVLQWSRRRWRQEIRLYFHCCRRFYALPPEMTRNDIAHRTLRNFGWRLKCFFAGKSCC